jgi:uncharacterized protein (DUF427 family)
MKATLKDRVIADSPDIKEHAGYQYFPESAVHMDWLQKAAKTPRDLECPHSVQFYDVVIDGERHERNAWIYEAPQPMIADKVAQRVGFWKDVAVG